MRVVEVALLVIGEDLVGARYGFEFYLGGLAVFFGDFVGVGG